MHKNIRDEISSYLRGESYGITGVLRSP